MLALRFRRVERYRMPVAVHLLLIDDEDRVLFGRRRGTGYLDGYWSVPSGHLESAETLLGACRREAREELDVDVPEGSLTFVLLQQKAAGDGAGERLDVFFQSRLRADQHPRIAEPDLCDELLWASPEALPQPLAPYVFTALRVVARGAPSGSHSLWRPEEPQVK